MSNPQHTPGPWSVKPGNPTSVGAYPGNYSIANCKMQGLFSETQKANAMLIAAAPDLLDAANRNLKVLKEMVDYTRRWSPDDIRITSMQMQIEMCETVIAKARGTA